MTEKMKREKRLAIKMWRRIRNRPYCDFYWKKKNFCEKHKLLWVYDCIFCEYFTCKVCPLSISQGERRIPCNRGGVISELGMCQYSIFGWIRWIRCCNKIIKAIKDCDF